MKHLVPATRQEQIKFLNKFPACKKVQEANAKGKKRVSVRWCGVNRGDCSNMGLWYETLRGKNHSCMARLVPLNHWKVQGMSVIESKLVDDDIGGHWSSNCSCHKYLESISIRHLCVNCTSLCRRKTQHSARVDKFFEGFMGATVAISQKKKMIAVGCLMSSLCIGWKRGDDIPFAGVKKVRGWKL